MKAIIFDLDGTLVDSAPDLMNALNKTLVQEGRAALPIESVRNMIGDGVPVLVERGFAATGEEATGEYLKARIEDFMGYYEGHNTDETVPYPGIIKVLDDLKASGHYTLGVCTNKPQAPTVEILAELHLAHYFSAVLGGDACDVKKPDPGHIFATLDALGVAPEHALLVGDSPNDAYAARDAGVPGILVSFGYTRIPVNELPSVAVIDHFDELPALIEKFL
ncbi:phosphoglycolate phosphatase [Magnetospira sp. QH-2]|uniref:phosphoglycolate phosphatase n=1 Tax=Magnetospira sp. (strain QH-2) TaxID=1288970 RepID=UPI0003E8176B|nr:phosphoglycolate phosphatase [Magnetospira sp. QH-2]CCQ72757.1 Phosphoglycolate phosphatase [Magnetospira sp. QH-2]